MASVYSAEYDQYVDTIRRRLELRGNLVHACHEYAQAWLLAEDSLLFDGCAKDAIVA